MTEKSCVNSQETDLWVTDEQGYRVHGRVEIGKDGTLWLVPDYERFERDYPGMTVSLPNPTPLAKTN